MQIALQPMAAPPRREVRSGQHLVRDHACKLFVDKYERVEPHERHYKACSVIVQVQTTNVALLVYVRILSVRMRLMNS